MVTFYQVFVAKYNELIIQLPLEIRSIMNAVVFHFLRVTILVSFYQGYAIFFCRLLIEFFLFIMLYPITIKDLFSVKSSYPKICGELDI